MQRLCLISLKAPSQYHVYYSKQNFFKTYRTICFFFHTKIHQHVCNRKLVINKMMPVLLLDRNCAGSYYEKVIKIMLSFDFSLLTKY